jgi:hypothetical protein
LTALFSSVDSGPGRLASGAGNSVPAAGANGTGAIGAGAALAGEEPGWPAWDSLAPPEEPEEALPPAPDLSAAEGVVTISHRLGSVVPGAHVVCVVVVVVCVGVDLDLSAAAGVGTVSHRLGSVVPGAHVVCVVVVVGVAVPGDPGVVFVAAAAVAKGAAAIAESAITAAQPKRRTRNLQLDVKARVTSTGPSNRSLGDTACGVWQQHDVTPGMAGRTATVTDLPRRVNRIATGSRNGHESLTS